MSKKFTHEIIVKQDTSASRNPMVSAERKRYANCGAAGFHTPDKYIRRQKHKTPLE